MDDRDDDQERYIFTLFFRFLPRTTNALAICHASAIIVRFGCATVIDGRRHEDKSGRRYAAFISILFTRWLEALAFKLIIDFDALEIVLGR